MLVLSRKTGERVVVDRKIEISVVEIKGNKVRLAFQAPDDVHICRKEILFDPEEALAVRLPVGAPA
jgi:carbon storage regulator